MATYGGISLNAEQLKNAQLIAATGRKMGASKRDIQIAIMTAMTESNLRNLNYGDRDSVGLFQQRAGWGSASQRMDPSHAATSFYKELFKVKNRNGMQPWQAAQAVQRSAFSDGSNYKSYWALGQQVSGKGNYGSGTFDASSDTGGGFVAPSLSKQELAESWGFAWSFLKNHPDVYAKFNQAVVEGWDAPRFVANLKNTKWWKQNANSVKQYQLLKANDPATLGARRTALQSQIRDSALQLGAALSNKTLARITENALMFGWNDNQLRDILGGSVHAINGVFNGQAGTDADQLRQMAWRNGVKLSSATLQGWVKSIAQGERSVGFYQQQVRGMAKTLAPGFASQIEAGQDLYDIAQPYLQAKAQLLQLDPAKIDLQDPDIRKALSAKDSAGKPTSQSLWEFEDSIRQKPEYLKTDAARDQAYGTAHKVLDDFGFMGA